MNTFIATVLLITTLTTAACTEEPVQVRHVTWVDQPACANQDMGDSGCADMGSQQDMGCAADMTQISAPQ